jgi:hypothetical protein
LEPALAHVYDESADDAAPVSGPLQLVVVEVVLQHAEDGLEGDTDVDEDVDGPFAVAAGAVGVLLADGLEDVVEKQSQDSF